MVVGGCPPVVKRLKALAFTFGLSLAFLWVWEEEDMNRRQKVLAVLVAVALTSTGAIAGGKRGGLEYPRKPAVLLEIVGDQIEERRTR